VKNTLGINEALILAALASEGECSVAQVAQRVVRHRDVDDGSIYVALQRMAERGFVTRRKVTVQSADRRAREVGVYKITGEGTRAVDEWSREAAAVTRLRTAGQLA
jgi:DNA-binding PadR family transcriptional regulator